LIGKEGRAHIKENTLDIDKE